jgi:hypothetical protein
MKGEINLEQLLWNGEEGITGCVPDQLFNTLRPFGRSRCSDANNTELLALKTLKDIVDKDGRVLTSWKDDPADFKPNSTLGMVCLSILSLRRCFSLAHVINNPYVAAAAPAAIAAATGLLTSVRLIGLSSSAVRGAESALQGGVLDFKPLRIDSSWATSLAR